MITMQQLRAKQSVSAKILSLLCILTMLSCLSQAFLWPAGMAPSHLPASSAMQRLGRGLRSSLGGGVGEGEAEILEANVDNALTFTIAFWAEVARAMEDEAPRDALLMCPNIPEDAVAMQSDAYMAAAKELEDVLPDLLSVRTSIEAPTFGPLKGINGIRITRIGKSYPPGDSAQADCAVAALKEWVDDVVAGMKVCPYTSSADLSAVSLESKGVQPGGVTYPASLGTCSAAVIRDLWFATADMLNAPATEVATVVMSAPHFASGPGSFKVWVAWTELLCSSLRMFAIDNLIKLIVFHPEYSRDMVEPIDSPAHCHLPPLTWMPPMMRTFYASSMAEDGQDDKFPYHVSDFQRRAPCPAVNILRGERLSTFPLPTAPVASLSTI
jgi:hypothetical protein